MPEASSLALIRREIDRKPHKLKRILRAAELRREFLNSVPDDEKKVVEEFVSGSSVNALKTKPKSFDADHRDIALLRLRSFTVSRKLPDEVFSAPDGINQIADLLGILTPLVTYLNSVVLPDFSGSSEGDSGASSGDEEG
ncbi:MAG: hypothetical protein M1839_006882 [Geoglossum umbratile]|nr:MAG: hypothetical protein M1839_006882 [Geoglossum umbratile]